MPAAVPRLHVLVGDEEAARPDFAAIAGRLREAGGPELALHLRLREASDRALFRLAGSLAADARAAGGWCVVNGRPDIALAAGAQAVQLGDTALPPGPVAALARGRLRIGASVHGEDEALEAVRGGANHLVLGTIHPTPSHPGRPGAGPALVRRVRRALAPLGPIPVVAIGGIDRPRVAGVLRAGADGIAVRRAVWAARDPVGAARELLEEWEPVGGDRRDATCRDPRRPDHDPEA